MGFEAIKTNEKGVKIKRQEQTFNGGSFPTFSVMVYTKNGDEFIVGYIPCQFRKGVEVADKTRINIKNAFYRNSVSKGKVYTKLFIEEFEILEEGENAIKVTDDGFMDIPDNVGEELPFV